MNSLSVRILCDCIPEQLHRENTVIYCFAHHKVNVPIMAKTLSYMSVDYPIYIVDNEDEMSGVSSFKTNKKIYEKYHVENIKPIPYGQTWINTKIECNAIIPFFVEKEIENVIIVTPAFHMERAIMTFVSSLMEQDEDRNIMVYAKPATIYNWNDITCSHQGRTTCSFFDMVQLEKERIDTYRKKGDIKSEKDVLHYFKERDKRFP